MAFAGFELIFECSKPLVRKEDTLILFVHWKLWGKGFLSIPLIKNFDEPSDSKMEMKGSELLPKDWNANPEYYEIHYVHGGQVYLLKALIVDQQLCLSILCQKDEQVVNVTLDATHWIGSNFQTLNDAYNDISGLEEIIQKELLDPLLKQKSVTKPQTSTKSSTQTEETGLDRPQHHHVSTNFPSPNIDPFGYGRGDLDPLGGLGSGGMIIYPRRGGMRQPQVGIPRNLPPGAVPPGARFDPFGPPDFASPMRGPRPRGGFGDPDYDHLQPPDYI